MAFDIQSAIDSFWQAAQRGDYFPPDWYDKLDLDAAYRIQLGLIARRCAEGERQIGWKVGLTAPAIQQQFGFHEPVFGCILHSDESGSVFRPDELIKPGFEPELCLRIGRDLTGSVTAEEARGAIDMVYPALEIIETRGPFTEQIAVALADNAQQKTVVLGAGVALPRGLALDRVEASVSINGATAATGRGDAVLGNPVNSVVWLAGKLGEYGRMLKAGEIIMSGSFTRQFPIAPGDRVRVDFAGVGAVETSMSG
ncbi:MAG TPA: fumarylacetoacetate hydrolase family protein [Acetobacteraceae bacterium]|jgi:2-keto-4-pentenoate hydratase